MFEDEEEPAWNLDMDLHDPSKDYQRPSSKAIAPLLLLLFIMCAGVSGCLGIISGCLSSMANGQQQARTLAAAMHQRMISGDLAGIYDGASQRYRNAVTRDRSDALYSAVIRKLGTPGECTQQGFNMKATTSGTVLELVCKTKFSKDATGVETFTWIKSGDQFQLLGYHINSEELIER